MRKAVEQCQSSFIFRQIEACPCPIKEDTFGLCFFGAAVDDPVEPPDRLLGFALLQGDCAQPEHGVGHRRRIPSLNDGLVNAGGLVDQTLVLIALPKKKRRLLGKCARSVGLQQLFETLDGRGVVFLSDRAQRPEVSRAFAQGAVGPPRCKPSGTLDRLIVPSECIIGFDSAGRRIVRKGVPAVLFHHAIEIHNCLFKPVACQMALPAHASDLGRHGEIRLIDQAGQMLDRIVVLLQAVEADTETVAGHGGLVVVAVAFEKFLVFRDGQLVQAAVRKAVRAEIGGEVVGLFACFGSRAAQGDLREAQNRNQPKRCNQFGDHQHRPPKMKPNGFRNLDTRRPISRPQNPGSPCRFAIYSTVSVRSCLSRSTGARANERQPDHWK